MIFDAYSIWIIAVSVGVILTVMVSSFFAYLCGCCKKIPNRDELLGISGVVKITNPESELNSTAIALSMTKTISDDNVPNNVLLNGASAKRLNGIGNNACNAGSATRSLPELPVYAATASASGAGDQVDGNFTSYSGAGDTSSDLYATLEEHKSRVVVTVTQKSKIIANGTLFNSNATSSLAATYEQIDEDPAYNKVQNEHPYAQVIESDSSTRSYEPEHSLLERRNTSAVDEVDGPANIPAASAIAGSIAASNELPYMTPPLNGEHFSGDSQDSAKGYTSISVREPLSRIRRSNVTKRDALFDSHYTVLSDDSDEMYAAIQELAYTSGSETYAQIQPLPSANPTYCSVPETVQEVHSPQKFGSTVHSRQASTSSIASSLTNYRHSPKEKRQANSPLPKPPDLSTDDMYAKVLKKRRNDDRCNSRDSVYNSDPDNASSLNLQAGPSNVIEKPEHREDADAVEARAHTVDDNHDDFDRYACGYETLPERNYEMLAEVNSSIGYETVKETFEIQNSGYESLPEPDSLTPGYERIREPNAGYEKIKYAAMKEEESDPNYEELKPKESNESEPFHCYATISKKGHHKANVTSSEEERAGEPDYASLTRRAKYSEDDALGADNDPFYERIRGRRTSSSNLGPTSEENENEVEMNNNHSSTATVAAASNSSHPASSAQPDDNEVDRLETTPATPPNINDLYSKVNKSVKR